MLEDGEDELEDLHPPTQPKSRAVGLDDIEEHRQTPCPNIQLAAAQVNFT